MSDGPSGEANDLHMTYAFEFELPHIQEGSEEAGKELKRLKGVSTCPLFFFGTGWGRRGRRRLMFAQADWSILDIEDGCGEEHRHDSADGS